MKRPGRKTRLSFWCVRHGAQRHDLTLATGICHRRCLPSRLARKTWHRPSPNTLAIVAPSLVELFPGLNRAISRGLRASTG